MPYLGFQKTLVSSPNAITQSELEAVDNFDRADLVFGVTLLKRVVPGWFLKAEVGSDILASFGVAVEF